MASKREIKVAYHLVDLRNWESIQTHGLHSTRSLMAMSGETDMSSLREHRPQGLRLGMGAYIRDQRPMPIRPLQRALRSGVTPADWFELLNSKVFFWLDIERLNRHRAACKNGKQLVLAIDAGRLLEAYADMASVSPINTGNAMRTVIPRNRSTFVPYARWVEDGWDSIDVPDAAQRQKSHRPVELTVTGAIPDLARFVIGSVYLDTNEKLTGQHIVTASGLSAG